ncbi:MAG: hypothetical protein QOC70_2137 [Verrucomicrobiota bacterium]
MPARNRIRHQLQSDALIAAILGRAASFLNELSLCFDPVVRRVALQGQLDPPLRDEIGAKPDFFVRRLVDRAGQGSVFWSGWLAWVNGFLAGRRLFLLGLWSWANGFRFRSGAAVRGFRPWGDRLFFCFDFGFSGHVLLSPIECQIY